MKKMKLGRYRDYIYQIICDVITVLFSLWLSVVLKFDGITSSIPQRDMYLLACCTIIAVLFCFTIFGVYRSMWEYPNLHDYLKLMCGFVAALAIVVFSFNSMWSRPFFSVFFIAGMISGICVLFSRLAVKWAYSYKKTRNDRKEESTDDAEHSESVCSNVLIIGAGEAGTVILKELTGRQYKNKYRVCALVDDDPLKQGKLISGVTVGGTCKDIVSLCEKYNITDIYFAIPSATASRTAQILKTCKKTGAQIKRLPGIYQLIDGTVSVSKLRPVDYSDLLGREHIDIDLRSSFSVLSGSCVLVTGAGGSIGSELCRQLAAYAGLKRLVMFDIYENTTYDIQQELKREHPGLDIRTIIGSICNAEMLDTLFDRYEIEYVFHAAAHKHVPLMEHVPSEAFNNNIFGTYTLVKAADAHHVKRFVMISTDKAVNPTSVMGATKRVCEMIVQAYDKRSDTDFVSVRFGNVLGSHGSVIPIFREQIANGGPITVTDKRMVRYFMMIDEAVSLVITAGVKAKGGEIFVLDMGSPVKIYDLAQNMIRFSGLKDSDIKIEITGLREGEKLYEEPLLSKETADKTEDELIYIGHPKEFDEGLLFKTLDETYPKRAELTANQAVSLLKLLVKEFQHDEYEYKNII